MHETRLTVGSAQVAKKAVSFFGDLSTIERRRSIVPGSEQYALFRLRELISNIPHVTDGAFVCTIGVPDVTEAKATLSKAVHAGLLDEINSLGSDLNRLSQTGAQHRERTIAKRMLLYKELKDNAEMYRVTIPALDSPPQRALNPG